MLNDEYQRSLLKKLHERNNHLDYYNRNAIIKINKENYDLRSNFSCDYAERLQVIKDEILSRDNPTYVFNFEPMRQHRSCAIDNHKEIGKYNFIIMV